MIRQFTVALPAEASLQRSVLASLPDHFRIVASGTPDAALLLNAGEPSARVNVLEGAALLAGVGGRQNAVPSFPFLERLGAANVFDRTGATAWPLLDIVTTIGSAGIDLRPALLEQVAVVRAVLGKRPRIGQIDRTAFGYVAATKAEGTGTVVTLTGVMSPAGGDSLTLDAVSTGLRFHARMDENARGRAATIAFFGPDGTSQPMSVHQSGRRLTWLRAHRILAGGERPDSATLDEDTAEVLAAMPL